jgi:hypothetical protein
MEIISPGRTLVCQIANDDSNDKYLFPIGKVSPALEVKWKLKGCRDNGKLTVGGKALEGGVKLMDLCQGTVSRWKNRLAESTDVCKAGCDCHTVPFILSRTSFNDLASGKPIELNVLGEIASYSPKKGRVTRTVDIDGQKTKVQCLQATGRAGKLWVTDDAQWPVLLRVEAGGGDTYSELLIISRLAPKEVEAQLGKAKDEDD